MAELHEESYKQGYVDGVKSKVAEELADVIGAVVEGMYEAIVKSSERIVESVNVDKIKIDNTEREKAKYIPYGEEEKYKSFKDLGVYFDGACGNCGTRLFNTDKYCSECGREIEYDY